MPLWMPEHPDALLSSSTRPSHGPSIPAGPKLHMRRSRSQCAQRSLLPDIEEVLPLRLWLHPVFDPPAPQVRGYSASLPLGSASPEGLSAGGELKSVDQPPPSPHAPIAANTCDSLGCRYSPNDPRLLCPVRAWTTCRGRPRSTASCAAVRRNE